MDDIVARWLPLVQSPLGIRLARAKARWSVPMPRFEHDGEPVDDFEQWLIEEALMAAYEERTASEQREAAEAEERRARFEQESAAAEDTVRKHLAAAG